MIFKTKETKLFIILASFFIANAIIAEFIGVKIFSVEGTLGINPLDINLFGIEHLSLNMSAGVLNWPIVFIMTDLINEYFGKKGVKTLSYIAVIMIAYGFLTVYSSIQLVPANFWISKQLSNGMLIDMNLAYNSVLGQGLWIIIGSITAFLLGQIIDVTIFHWIKSKTGEKGLWLRATGSTLISQLLDSVLVIGIAFYLFELVDIFFVTNLQFGYAFFLNQLFLY